jgi:cation diffusion facilitator CzcD-associated flavoprotein CzcO
MTTVNNTTETYDAIIIGGGISGMYQLYLLREMGLSVRVFEAGGGVGGTWYWNRYPGARFDSESYSYCYSFSKELLEEWDWKEHFAPQPETLEYLNFVADKFDLRKDIQFNARVKSTIYNEADSVWDLETEDGDKARAPLLITALGALTAPKIIDIPGKDTFEGEQFHTSQIPQDPDGYGSKYKTFAGMRVGVIGTGATGVQVIQETSKTADSLTVFQVEPEYCSPLRNGPIDDEAQKEIKATYPEIFQKCRESYGSFVHTFDERSIFDFTDEEREAFFEELYQRAGFAIWLANCGDILTNPKANDLITDFIRRKIRARINDPKVADKLVPTNHGFGTRRVPMETNYYEVYNQDNVELADISETPITEITPKGIKTGDKEYELDLIVYATGFDAITGGFDNVDIRGKGGEKLIDKWADGPQTYLGLQVSGFPNMFMLVGPHSGGTFCNIPRCIEQNVEWVSDFIKYMRDNNLATAEATKEAEDTWTAHVDEIAEPTLFTKTKSWYMGANIPGKKRKFLLYAGGGPTFRKTCDDIAAKGYEGFELR